MSAAQQLYVSVYVCLYGGSCGWEKYGRVINA